MLVNMAPKKRSTPFNRAHEAEYGLKISQRDHETGSITIVACRFCQCFGREDKIGQKRKPATTTKYFKKPFRAELYKQHLIGQHSAKWKEYCELPLDRKDAFFEVVPIGSTLHSHFVGASDQLFFDINPSIVDVIIGDLLIDEEDENTSVDSVLSVFDPVRSEEGSVLCYRAHIRNVKLFKFVIGTVALGASFRLASRQVLCAREELSLGYLGGCTVTKVSRFVRVAAAACLQKLSEIMSAVWAFSLAFDSSTIESTSYFDVRVRFVAGTNVHCFHLFSLPLFGSHTGDLMFSVFGRAMDALCPSWTQRLLSTCSDGARNMTGRVRGIVSRVATAVEAHEGYRLLRFWCGAHQLDLVVQRTVSKFCGDEFYSSLTAVIGYLRRQQNLMSEMRGKCPKVAATRWLSLGKVLPWFVKHRTRVCAYLDQKNPACKPTMFWWLAVLSLAPIVTEIDILFKTLQHGALLVPQQRLAFDHCGQCFRELTQARGPLQESQLREWEPSSGHRSGEFVVSNTHVSQFIRGQGSFASLEFQELSAADRHALVDSVGKLVVDLLQGIHSIEPERDGSNQPLSSLPPCLPNVFAKMRPLEFVDIVVKFRPRLQKLFDDQHIDEVETEHRNLHIKYNREETFRRVLDSLDDSLGFSEAWSPLRAEFPKLCSFAGGIATVYPGTTRVESDFSIMGWEKDEFRASLLDVSLEGIMQSKQFKDLQSINIV